MLIGIDADEVMADFVGSCAARISEPLRKMLADPEVYGTLHSHDRFAALRKEEEREIWEFIEKNPGFVRSLPMFEGVQEFLQQLRTIGEVVAVTAPASSPPTWGHEREHWLRDELQFERNQIIQTCRKDLADVDVLIEDNPGNLERWWYERKRRCSRFARTEADIELDMASYHLAVLYVDNRYRPLGETEWPVVRCDSYEKIVSAVQGFKTWEKIK